MKHQPQTAVAVKTAAGRFVWFGVDVSKATMDAAAWLGESDKPHQHHFARTLEGAAELARWCRGICAERAADQEPGHAVEDGGGPVPRLVMESTGGYSAQLADWMLLEDIDCSIVNPSFIKSFGESLGVRNKTDRTDALVIARFGADRTPALYQPPDPLHAQMRELVRERACLVRMRADMKNRDEHDPETPLVIRIRRQHMAHIDKAIDKLDAQLRKLTAQDPQMRQDMQRLDTIPGVGFTTAVTVVAELGDLRRFDNARQLSSYAGTSPKCAESGTSVKKRTHMSKMGNPAVRAALYMAAVACIKTATPLGDAYRKLVARGKPPKVAIGALMRRILITMRAILISNRPYSKTHASNPSAGEQTCGENGAKTTP